MVFGILIAFSLDSWWETKKANEWERDQLELLRDEAQYNVEHLTAVIKTHEHTAAQLQDIIEFSTTHPSGDSSIFKNRVITALISWRTAEVSMGALDALLASGEIGELNNSELRRSLTAWRALVLNAEEKENLARDFIEYVLVPALIDEEYVVHAYEARPPYANSDEMENRNVVVRSSTQLSGLSVARFAHNRMAIISQNRSLAALQEILLIIEEELAG